MLERIKKRIEKLSTAGESSIQEPQEEPLPHDSEPHIEPSSSPPQVEEEIPEPNEDCSVQEPLVDTAIYEDSDSDSDWGGPVCPRWEDLPYCQPKLQEPSLPWHEWEDTSIGSLWGADDEADDSLVPIPIEVKAPTHTFEEFSVSHINQVCDELERLVYGDSYGEEHHEKFSIPCHIGYFIDDPYAIVKELEINKCGGVDELHGSFEEHLAQMRYYWDDFMARDSFEPSGTWWKFLKKINCKMKGVSFHNCPPSSEHRGAREVIEKRWWKKKKWRDKAVSTILFG